MSSSVVQFSAPMSLIRAISNVWAWLFIATVRLLCQFGLENCLCVYDVFYDFSKPKNVTFSRYCLFHVIELLHAFSRTLLLSQMLTLTLWFCRLSRRGKTRRTSRQHCDTLPTVTFPCACGSSTSSSCITVTWNAILALSLIHI